ncbi:MAG: hypothetical protein WD894_24980 [Pirellulales bacterium]
MSPLRAFALFGLLAWAAGCGKGTTSKFDTPEAAFNAFQKAMEAEDWQAAARCLTPESQATMADGLIFGSSFATFGDTEKAKDLKQLLKRYEIDMDAEPKEPADKDAAAMPSFVADVENKPALIEDLFAWLNKNSTSGSPTFEIKNLGEVKIDGDEATAMAETERGDQPVEFRKVDGGWLIHLPNGGGPTVSGDGPELPPPGIVPPNPFDAVPPERENVDEAPPAEPDSSDQTK